jgi:hypothetical protein
MDIRRRDFIKTTALSAAGRASRPAVAPRRDPSKHADKANRVSQSVD